MRPKERIPIFLELVDLKKLSKRWELNNEIQLLPMGLEEEWSKVPDQRFGQFLINSGLLP